MPEPIRQPRNARIKAVIRQQKIEVNLAWNKVFGKEQTNRFSTVQKFVDSECIRLMVKYTPARNNILYKSATLGTKIGSGHIYYNSPYARYLYYGKVMVDSVTGKGPAKIPEVGYRFRKGATLRPTDRNLTYTKDFHPKATARWFEVSKARNLAKWERVLKEAITNAK